MRGIPFHAVQLITKLRITPACAGNTRRCRGLDGSRWDHPRVCGEYLAWQKPRAHKQGSPPRVRGILVFNLVFNLKAGITPACAGNTPSGKEQKMKIKDHPRVCGEYACSSDVATISTGSPPRVRGIQKIYFKCLTCTGITPACAGNTSPIFPGTTCIRDHPRVCGEYLLGAAAPVGCLGSPPRVRGILTPFFMQAEMARITPACAGNTPGPYFYKGSDQDHPRVCGEYSKKIPWLTPCHLN